MGKASKKFSYWASASGTVKEITLPKRIAQVGIEESRLGKFAQGRHPAFVLPPYFALISSSAMLICISPPPISPFFIWKPERWNAEAKSAFGHFCAFIESLLNPNKGYSLHKGNELSKRQSLA